jgi:hypothetical protein
MVDCLEAFIASRPNYMRYFKYHTKIGLTLDVRDFYLLKLCMGESGLWEWCLLPSGYRSYGERTPSYLGLCYILVHHLGCRAVC